MTKGNEWKDEEFRRWLKSWIKNKYGSIFKADKALGLGKGTIGHVLRGTRIPTEDLVKQLGLTRVVRTTYRRMNLNEYMNSTVK